MDMYFININYKALLLFLNPDFERLIIRVIRSIKPRGNVYMYNMHQIEYLF